MDLYRRSIQVILEHQADSGAYVASPNFPSYAYCWLRDGSFIAHAMDRVGEHGSARAFFEWVDRAIRGYAWKVDLVLDKLAKGQDLEEGDYLHTRYTLDGKETKAEWWNFQLDGYGTWLWALAEHTAITGDTALLAAVAESVHVAVRYLSAVWMFPNYDCWEEHPLYTHPYTLAAIYAGLKAAGSMLAVGGRPTSPSLESGPSGEPLNLVEEIRRFVLQHGVQDGHLVKHIDLPGETTASGGQRLAVVDASLIGVATPYRLLAPDEPLMQATAARIETDLYRPGGGVYRYLADTYFGGGEWVLLAAWLGWYYAELGEWERARQLLHWVEAQANGDGHLPEQVSTHLLAPERYAEWETRWGPVAKTLLWSHAMYLILHQALESTGQE
jgi:GH15 family glucan-1,4-alpha-glucosidase